MTGLRGLCAITIKNTKTRHTRDPNLLPNYESVLARNPGLKKGKKIWFKTLLQKK